MFPLLYISNLQQQIKQILCGFVVWSADLMHLSFWNSQPSYILIKMAPLTTYQHSLTFSCSRKGPQLLFHVTLPSMYSNHSKTKKWHVPKTSLLTEILLSEVSCVYWYENKMYIWYCSQLLITWLISNFCFWAVFSHVSWFEISHIVGIWYVIYISGDVSDSKMIISVHI